MTRALVARAPTRIDFGGGWTDVPPYGEREGGAVCNVAISRYATASVAIGGHAGVAANPSGTADDRLLRAALRRSPIANVEASISSDFPVAAGLGGSSAAGVALAGALADLSDTPMQGEQLALLSRTTEVEELGIAGGYQDHYAAAIGGALLLEFTATVHVERIPLSDDIAAALARRALVVYSGQSRISGETIDAVRGAYLAGERRVVHALARTAELAHEMAAALRASDLDTLGTLVGEQWEHQRALHPSITTPRIDAMSAAAMQAGALGVKALGASGGGCVLAFAADGREDAVASALAPLGDLLEYSLDTTGFTVLFRGTTDG